MSRPAVLEGQAALLEVRGLDVETAAGRPLVRGLGLTLGRERVALIGRNGAGKSSLLAILAGAQSAARGTVVRRGTVLLVPQDVGARDVADAVEAFARGGWAGAEAIGLELAAAGLPPLDALVAGARLSTGERRKLLLCRARVARPDLLLLDEPSQDLDQPGCEWLRSWLGAWDGAALVASHDRSLLRLFRDFMVLAESGCRHLEGDLDVVEHQLLEAEDARRRDYARRLGTLEQKELRSEQFRRRRARKKNRGRVNELGRATPRIRLNQKRSYAQEKQGRIEGVRLERLARAREWARAARRALTVSLPLTEVIPRLGPPTGEDVLVLEGVAADAGGRRLFSGVDLRVRRDRVAITGANGTGKTTLLRTILGLHPAARGRVRTRHERVGAVAQGATDWMLDESLVERLALTRGESPDALVPVLAAHRFPLELATRPLSSLSPGERFRAALICLLERNPPVEVLVLDEPTYGLDFVGLAALRELLRSWEGGLVVVSHEPDLFAEIGIERVISLPCG